MKLNQIYKIAQFLIRKYSEEMITPESAADLFNLDIESFDDQDLKKSYRKLTLKYHPNISDDKRASDKMMLINNAKEVLEYFLKAKQMSEQPFSDYEEDWFNSELEPEYED